MNKKVIMFSIENTTLEELSKAKPIIEKAFPNHKIILINRKIETFNFQELENIIKQLKKIKERFVK